MLVCDDVQEFSSVLECAVDEAGAAVDATFGEEAAAFCEIQFSSGNQWEGLLLSLSGTDSILASIESETLDGIQRVRNVWVCLE